MSKRDIESEDMMQIPNSETEALEWLLPLLDIESRGLRRVSNFKLKRGWAAILFLYSGLHPDGACERGSISNDIENYSIVSDAEPRLLNPYYKLSGWPVVLVPVAEEVWRRFESDEYREHEIYCSDAQIAGMQFRNTMPIDSQRLSV